MPFAIGRQVTNESFPRKRYLDFALHENECRHGRDVELLSRVLRFVDVDIQEDDVVVRLGHLFNLGRDHLARAAPGRVKVDDDLKRLERKLRLDRRPMF